LLECLQTQRMYFPTFCTLFYLEVWNIIYNNQHGNWLFLVLTSAVIFSHTVIFPVFVIEVVGIILMRTCFLFCYLWWCTTTIANIMWG
jgi:hypothetical protein